MRGPSASEDGLISRRRLLFLLGATAVGVGVGGRSAVRGPRTNGRFETTDVIAGADVGPPPAENSATDVLGGTWLRWSDPKTWGGGAVPGASDTPIIDRQILLDVDASVAGLEIGPTGSLVFDPNANRTLTSRRNVVVRGRLTMRPAR